MSPKTPSKLERILRSGRQAVTSECGPPRGSDATHIVHKAEQIRNHVDAINVTDNQTSVCRLCSLAACIRLKLMGVEPVLQMVVRDRNRIALQSDLLGAASFDIHNVLCLSGDHQRFGDCAQGQNVFDIDSMQLVQTVRRMRDEGRFLGGDPIQRPPAMFVGAAANPFADPFEIRVPRLAKKVAAGAEFIQTQCIYNLEKFESWMGMVRDRGLHEKVFILAGVTPLKSAGMARYMKTKVPGMDVPDEVVKRMAGVPKEKQAEEGITLCIETLQRLKEVQGVSGFHIMAIEWEERVPEIVERAGLFPRPAAVDI
jgi:methylenetetrahydrofolate reductase (NADPH)